MEFTGEDLSDFVFFYCEDSEKRSRQMSPTVLRMRLRLGVEVDLDEQKKRVRFADSLPVFLVGVVCGLARTAYWSWWVG